MKCLLALQQSLCKRKRALILSLLMAAHSILGVGGRVLADSRSSKSLLPAKRKAYDATTSLGDPFDVTFDACVCLQHSI